MEETVFIPSGSDVLCGVLYRPDRGASASGLVMCHPLLEERKSAQRVMVEAARAFASAGIAVLRFDYRGCGDSTGNLDAFGCEDWRADIATAVRFLTEQTAAKPLGLLGLRLGASLAMEAAAAHPVLARFLVLWEPILNGRRHLDQELRRKLVNEMVTFGQSRTTRAGLLKDLETGLAIDVDGYSLTPRLFSDIGAIDLLKAAPRVTCKTLLARIARSGVTEQDLRRLQETLRSGGATADAIQMDEDPFWNLVGLVECPSLIAQTRQWLMTT